jgi:uncharacterized repeat protein (TIGR03837 family)
MHWDLFCRVIDNFGDIGVCWRLAADLGARGQHVRLWVDDPSALAWMAPGGAPGVELRHWCDDTASAEPGEVVIEAFGCDPPPGFVQRMARRARPPLWINLEYLSAEAYVRRNHGLRSPQPNGLPKWFFYPGFEPGTGGLIREPGLMAERRGFDRRAWLQARGIGVGPGERVVSLFCYPGAPVDALLHTLADAPTLLLATPGAASQAVQQAPRALRCVALPWLSQPEYDRLLWACDLNFVRGEDSFVRAQWAGAPFVWQIYPQHDAAHAAKLDAFLGLMLQGADPGLVGAVRGLWRAWNGLHGGALALPQAAPWQAQALHWRERLLTQADLGSQLLGFVAERR